MRLQIEVIENGQSTAGANWTLRVRMDHQGRRGVAECLLWETDPGSFTDGFQKIADAIQKFGSESAKPMSEPEETPTAEAFVITFDDALPGDYHRDVKANGQKIGFSRSSIKHVCLERCPRCQRENYVMNVIYGVCTWCGWDANKPSSIVRPETKGNHNVRDTDHEPTLL